MGKCISTLELNRIWNFSCTSRATAAHHCPFVLWDVTTESLLLSLKEAPFVLEWVESHLHNATQNFPVSFTLHSLNYFI